MSDGIDVAAATESDNYLAINPIDLPRVDRAAAISGAGEGIYAEPPGTMRQFDRYGAAFVDDPDRVGLFSGMIGPARYSYPPGYTAFIDNPLLVGYRTLLTPAKQFFTDEAYVEPEVFLHQLNRISQPDPFANEETGLRPTDREGFFRFEPGDRIRRDIPGAAVVLCSDEPMSYGSFLFRVVPKIWAIRDLGLSGSPCVVYAPNGPFRDLLELGGIPARSIVEHDIKAITRVERAIVPGMRNPNAYLDPESFRLFAELRERHGVPQGGRRIYVSRLALNRSGLGASRVMDNEGELIARLEAMRFGIVEPENLSVRDQVKIFSSAGIVVGPSGSGLFNTMFCHPGTKVIDIQSEPQWIYSYTGMYSSLKLDYGIFVGKPDPADTKPVHRRFKVNIDALVSRIRAFMDELSW